MYKNTDEDAFHAKGLWVKGLGDDVGLKVIERTLEDSIISTEKFGHDYALVKGKAPCMVEEGSTVCLRVGDPCAELVEPDPEALIAAERCKAEGVAQAVRRSRNAPERAGTYRSTAGQNVLAVKLSDSCTHGGDGVDRAQVRALAPSAVRRLRQRGKPCGPERRWAHHQVHSEAESRS